MTTDDATVLETMMRSETSDYMVDFLAFAEGEALIRQQTESGRDFFMSLCADGRLAGFFCLRGLDAGFARPSFGVYVARRFASEGLGRFALNEALRLCAENEIPSVMLKVAPTNRRARMLYENAGFIPFGRCADTGHDMMEKVLDNT